MSFIIKWRKTNEILDLFIKRDRLREVAGFNRNFSMMTHHQILT